MDSSSLKYPIYIISKGRYENPITARYFERENIPYLIAVEPQEYNDYVKTLGSKRVLCLPFSNLGLGSYPARNFCWEHSIKNGHEFHHLWDDNIRGLVDFDNGNRHMKNNGATLRGLLCLERLTERYSNVGMSGFNYRYFATKETKKPFMVNTHVYSAMLIRNALPYRWRLKYNEDVDLNLQMLHDGWCTVALNAFLSCKTSTVAKLKGGNQDELYKGNALEKKMLKAKSLEMMWPQYVKSTIRFGRPHHSVNWKKHFKHPLKKKVLNAN